MAIGERAKANGSEVSELIHDFGGYVGGVSARINAEAVNAAASIRDTHLSAGPADR
jgi:hypothetical protein